MQFQSTAPVWGPTRRRLYPGVSRGFQSTAPVWGPTTVSIAIKSAYAFQSTAPVWGPTVPDLPPVRDVRFQSTAPVWGPTTSSRQTLNCSMEFQSTAPVWGPTGHDPGRRKTAGDFNPRPPCGGRRMPLCPNWTQRYISIHGPRVGADGTTFVTYRFGVIFQSTAPVWGPTKIAFSASPQDFISIHGPRVGADVSCGRFPTDLGIFQSTAPVWGPTANVDKNAAAFLCICANYLHF